MTRPDFRSLAAALCVALAMLIPAVAQAQSTIRMVVNGRPITSYDISQRVALQQVGGERASSAAATQQLINEAIQLSELERLGANVSDGQITSAFAGIASQVQMTPANFTSALRQAGINPDTLRGRLRAQIAWSMLLQRRTGLAAPIRNQDVTAALLGDAGADAQRTIKEVTLQQILFVVPSGSRADRRGEAERFRSRYPGCDGALAAARGIRDVVVRLIGRRDESQLNGAQGEEILRTSVGRTTRPRQTEQGVELVGICSVREVQSDAVARAEVENRLLVEQGDALEAAYLAELKGRAIIINR